MNMIKLLDKSYLGDFGVVLPWNWSFTWVIYVALNAIMCYRSKTPILVKKQHEQAYKELHLDLLSIIVIVRTRLWGKSWM